MSSERGQPYMYIFPNQTIFLSANRSPDVVLEGNLNGLKGSRVDFQAICGGSKRSWIVKCIFFSCSPMAQRPNPQSSAIVCGKIKSSQRPITAVSLI